MSLCLAGGGAVAKLSAVAFTLLWTHTIEKTVWEEHWRVFRDRLVVIEARIQGSGAGMEPPPEAIFAHGFYSWRPNVSPLRYLVLRRAPEAGDWGICAKQGCKPFSELLPKDADPVRLYPCR